MIDEKRLIEEIKDWQIDIHDNEYNADTFDFVFERIKNKLVNTELTCL